MQTSQLTDESLQIIANLLIDQKIIDAEMPVDTIKLYILEFFERFKR